MKHINLGIVAHVDAGKTTLSEALLYKAGSIRHLGRVDSRDTFLDTYSVERERGITVFSKQAELELDNVTVTLLDTPGHVDFSAEAESVLQVLDYCILLISASDGIKGHTLTLWSLLKEYNVPTIIFVNKMDQPGADRDVLLSQIRDKLDDNCIAIDTPDDIGEDTYETIATCDEALMEEYLTTGGPISDERIASLINERKMFPCLFGSALKLTGTDELIHVLGRFTVNKEYTDDFAARVFKITRDAQGNRLTHLKVMGGVLRNKDMIGDEKVNQIRIYSGEKFEAVNELEAGRIGTVTGLGATRMGMGLGTLDGVNMPILEPVLCYKVSTDDGTDQAVLLGRLRILEEEDPQLIVSYDENTREILIRVMGEVQLQVLKGTVASRFGISIVFDTGTVLYKETIASPVLGMGHFEPLRHYAEVQLLLEPSERGSGLSFGSVCSEDMLDKNWQRLILTHLGEKMHRGVLTGSPITDMKISIAAGRAHTKHTEGGDFRQATYRAVRQGLMCAGNLLLEPYYFFRIELPTTAVGRAMTDIEKMNGKTTAPVIEGDTAVLTGTAPVVSIRNYAADLAAYTGGTGTISLSLAGYDLCHNTEEVVEEKGYIPESDLRNTPDSVFCAHGAGYVVPWNEVGEHMHVETPKEILAVLAGYGNSDDSDEDDVSGSGSGIKGYGASNAGISYKRTHGQTDAEAGTSLGTDEVDAILSKTFYSNSETTAAQAAEKRKGVGKKGRVVAGISHIKDGKNEDPYKDFKYKPVERKQKYLIVDGYNVIHAWEELKSLADINIDGARDRLVDIMSNYQGATDEKIILVFDAYRVHDRSVSEQETGNLKVVYTAQDQTADRYIERFSAENGRKYDITVATSDNMIQVIARGNNCLIISSRELEILIENRLKQIRDDYKIKEG
ncbi:MAG: NYN domain-containing protein [Lachnospiraceae bacterium]|nr:NYN domain-containing protein [Lachnospiraceae bacterium]